MLTRLDIKDFAVVAELAVEFAPGFTAITGETGAGKSIMLDALGLVLGGRASPDWVRTGASSADLSAEFHLGSSPDAAAWLTLRDLTDPDTPELCLLRRTVGADGRSRAFINGRPAPLQDVRELAGQLIDIHSQHAHQSLLRREVQRLLLDEYGGHRDLARSVSVAHDRWRNLEDEREALERANAEGSERRALLAYQLEELDALGPGPDEHHELAIEQKRLANADAHARRLAGTLAALDENEDAATALLARLEHGLDAVDDDHSALTSARELLASARVNCEEATSELRRYADLLEPDPQRLAIVDDRLGALHDLARKHRVRPEELTELRERIAAELESMSSGKERSRELAAEAAAARDRLLEKARKLSRARRATADRLARAVTAQLRELGMKHARFAAHLEKVAEDDCGPSGLERIEFQVSANKGIEPGPLGRIASGGELSRISLAIQVVTAATSRVPSLILDEADVGIGGRTAEVVGRLLQRLGDHAQVLAVTHLPQVAALAHQHLAVEKSERETARVRIRSLNEDARVEELARMLGGVEVTAQTRAHASEMRARAGET